MPSRYPKLEKMFLCNSKLLGFFVLITKTIKVFNDTKYCTFHRSVIRFSFSPIYLTKVFTFCDKVSKPPLTKIIP